MTGRPGDHRLERLVHWALGPEVLAAADVPHAVTVVTDTLAAILGAAGEPEVRGFAERAPSIGGSGPCTVLASGATTGAALAAWANGLAAVRLELDEGNQFAANHPAAHVFPAALATAEAVGATGQELLSAFAAGYEVAVRVAVAVRLRDTVHPFGTAMICGAALAVARLRGLAPDEAVRAVLVAAALTPASSQRAATAGATVRNAIAGACAAHGVFAVDLAMTGTSGEPTALHTVFGEILGTSYDDSSLDDALGERRYLTRNYLKLHACSRWNHAPIEAAVALMTEHGIRAADVDHVEVATYDPATRLADRAPSNGFAGKHSIPYAMAVRLVRGANGVADYTDELAADPQIRALMARVDVVEDPEFTRAAPAVRAARVTIRTCGGRTHSAVEDRPPGGFDRPYPAEAITAKHRELLSRNLSAGAASKLLDWCSGLPDRARVDGLPAILRDSR